MRTVRFTDVTLQENAKAGAGRFTFKEQVEIAKALDRLGVDTIRLAPILQPKADVMAVRTMATVVRESRLSIPVGLTEESVDEAWGAVAGAAKAELYVGLPVSTVQMEYICHCKPDKMAELCERLVKRARSHTDCVNFAAEDATRADVAFVAKMLSIAIEAGATTVTLCDSAGALLPHELADFLDKLYCELPVLTDITVAIQCSDELAVAAAAAVAAIGHGAGEIVVSMAPGVAAPSLAAMAQLLRVRGADLGCAAALRTTELQRALKQLDLLTSINRAHSGGASISADDKALVLDANDDLPAVAEVVRKLGYDLSEEDMAKVYEMFTTVAAKKDVGQRELEAIVATAALQVPPTYTLQHYVITSGNTISATANLQMQKDGRTLYGVCAGHGPIDAAFLAVEQVVGRRYELDDFQIQSVTEGKEAMGSALVKLRAGGKLYSGSGVSTDIIGASIRAYVNAINKIAYDEKI